MEQIKKELDLIKQTILSTYDPLAIILFGSYARNTPNSESDVDIAIIERNLSKKALFKLKIELEEKTMKDIDLINIANIDISETLRYEILMTGEVLYCKDAFKFDLYKLYAFREFLDFNEMRKDIIERIKNGGTIYGK